MTSEDTQATQTIPHAPLSIPPSALFSLFSASCSKHGFLFLLLCMYSTCCAMDCGFERHRSDGESRHTTFICHPPNIKKVPYCVYSCEQPLLKPDFSFIAPFRVVGVVTFTRAVFNGVQQPCKYHIGFCKSCLSENDAPTHLVSEKNRFLVK